MKAFTYNDYIECIHTLRLNAVLRLAEESTDYILELENTKEEKNKHDKLAKVILKDEKEMAKFINQFLKPKREIKSENLIKYTNSYITKKYKNKEADLVYKLQSDEIFFLVEHQSKIDHTMPYRILNYCIDFMQEWSRNRKIDSDILYPIIVPIIIYTGDTKWKMPKNFKDKQISDYVFDNYKINLEYNLIDINKLSTRYLLGQQSMFGYGMIIEKAKDKEELEKNIDLIIDDMKTRGQLEKLKDIIIYLFGNSLKEELKTALLEKIQIKIDKENDGMSTLYERLMAETARDIKKGKMEVVRGLIRNKISDSIIIDSSKISQKELDKLKKSRLVEK